MSEDRMSKEERKQVKRDRDNRKQRCVHHVYSEHEDDEVYNQGGMVRGNFGILYAKPDKGRSKWPLKRTG